MKPTAAKAVIAAGALAALAAGLMIFGWQERVASLVQDLRELGPAGALLFTAVYVIGTILLLPGSFLTLAAGAVYGLALGTALMSAASTLGALASFLIGRYIGREWVRRTIAAKPQLRSLDEAVGREGWKIVLLTRLSPAFPFNLLNYALALTNISFPAYALATWLGMLPGTVLYVYLGSLAGNLSALESSELGSSPIKLWWYACGFIATLGATFYLTRLARRALLDVRPEGNR